MRKCEWCGKSFDPYIDSSEFDSEMGASSLSYNRIRPCLCFNCAVEAIEDGADHVYYETCENCGKTFDLVDEKIDYSSRFAWYNGTDLTDEWIEHNKILCAECAIMESEKRS